MFAQKAKSILRGDQRILDTASSVWVGGAISPDSRSRLATGGANGCAYAFQISGALAVQDTVAIPMKVQNASSIRCIYAYLQQGTTDGQSAYLVKISRDGARRGNRSSTWASLRRSQPPSRTPRLPYADYGIMLAQDITDTTRRVNPAPLKLRLFGSIGRRRCA